MQTLVDQINTAEQCKIIQELCTGIVIDLAFHQTGNFVLQKIIENFTNQNLQFDFYQLPLIEEFGKLSLNNYGLCVAKQLIRNIRTQDKLKALTAKIIQNTQICLSDLYGNYALQEIIQKWELSNRNIYREAIANQILRICLTVKINKCNFSVIEKCIQKIEPEKFFHPLIDYILKNQDVMLNLMRTDQNKPQQLPTSKFAKLDNKQDDTYGNSLLSKIIEKLPRSSQKRTKLCHLIRHYITILKNDKKNRNFWDNYFMKDNSQLKKLEDEIKNKSMEQKKINFQQRSGSLTTLSTHSSSDFAAGNMTPQKRITDSVLESPTKGGYSEVGTFQSRSYLNVEPTSFKPQFENDFNTEISGINSKKGLDPSSFANNQSHKFD